jgi:hypothetical protein
MYCEASRKRTTSEHLYIKLKRSQRYCVCGLLVILYTSRWYSISFLTFCSKRDLPFTQPTRLTELFVKCIIGWLRWWVYFRFLPVESLHSLRTFGSVKPQDTLDFRRCVAIFLIAARLAANHSNCTSKLWFKSLTAVG